MKYSVLPIVFYLIRTDINQEGKNRVLTNITYKYLDVIYLGMAKMFIFGG